MKHLTSLNPTLNKARNFKGHKRNSNMNYSLRNSAIHNQNCYGQWDYGDGIIRKIKINTIIIFPQF